MALYAFDGTWNIRKDGEEITYGHTNVVRFHAAYEARSGAPQFYVAGVGTRFEEVGAIVGGGFGAGEPARLEEGYRALCLKWAAGDRDIDIVGFSRGAATALDFCHLILGRGITDPATGAVLESQPQIRFLGLWDVVGAFGLGFLGNVLLNIGHHLSMPAAGVRFCFHALALDEQRISFTPTRLPGAHEVWFRGVHSDIGGGNGNRGLNDITLGWMLCKAMAAGLPIADADIAALQPDPDQAPKPKLKLIDIRNVSAVDRRHYTAVDRQGWRCAPGTCAIETTADERQAQPVGAAGGEILAEAERRRVLSMWEAARNHAKAAYDVSLDAVQESMLALMQGRVALVTDDAQLARARADAVVLVDAMMHEAATRGWTRPADVFLNLALQRYRHLYPFTD